MIARRNARHSASREDVPCPPSTWGLHYVTLCEHDGQIFLLCINQHQLDGLFQPRWRTGQVFLHGRVLKAIPNDRAKVIAPGPLKPQLPSSPGRLQFVRYALQNSNPYSRSSTNPAVLSPQALKAPDLSDPAAAPHGELARTRHGGTNLGFREGPGTAGWRNKDTWPHPQICFSNKQSSFGSQVSVAPGRWY